ncbi:MAG: hypothetical protein C1O27_002508 [Chloroflexi bacterium]|nr:MAG: hypothetical protein C1O27_002508 [Chloroflexota bacterium]
MEHLALITERNVKFTSSDVELIGTLAQPEGGGPFPAVLLLPSSGPIDRNGNHAALHMNAFQLFAEALAEQGIASLRYDKRGVGASRGRYLDAGFHDNVADAQRALLFLRKDTSVQGRPVFLLGHSEGALISTLLAAKGVQIAGVILLAGGARSGEDMLRWQVQQVAKGMRGLNKWVMKVFRTDVVKAQQKRLNRLKQSSENSYGVQLVAKVNARWMREYIVYNPAVDLPKIRVPILAITGGKDIQVDPADLEQMSSLVKTDFESHVVPDVTHMLRPDAEDPPSLSSYNEQVKEPLDPRVVNLVSEWLAKRLSSQPSLPESK